MHATFVVNCWINMKPLNRTQLTNLQLCSNQSTNQPPLLIWGEGPPRSTFALSHHVRRSVPGCDAANFVCGNLNNNCQISSNINESLFCQSFNVLLFQRKHERLTVTHRKYISHIL